MPLRNRLLLAAATACAALALPSVAAADDYCVGSPAGCTGTAVAAPWLKVALHVAQSNGTDDRVFLAPGVFESNSFGHQSGERIQIIGAGAGKSILRGDSDQVLTLAGNQDSSVSGVTVEATGAASSGLRLIGTSARDVTVQAKGAASLGFGVELFGDAAFDDGSVDVGPAFIGQAIVAYSGAPTVTDSTVKAPEGAGLGTAASEATVRRSTLDAKVGAVALAGHLTVSDSVIDMRGKAGGGGSVGVYAYRSGSGATSVSVDADRLTILGSTPGGPQTIGAGAYAEGAGMSAEVRLRDSVINGIGAPVARQADNGATASLTSTNSAYPSAIVTQDAGAGSLVEQSRVKVTPGFVGNGDFRLAAGSPLIDAGTPGSRPSGATDRDGRRRASDGDGDCTHVSDIGAFEYQGTRVRAVASAAAATAAAGAPVGFSAAGSCIPGAEAPTIRWAFDDGATGAGETVAHAFQTPGRHTATVTVSDQHGHSAQATTAVEVTAPTAAAPRISRLRVAPARVRIGTTLPKLVPTAVERPLAAIGFVLDKPAKVTVRFARLGRHGAVRAVKPAITVKGRTGRNRIRFAARVTRRVALQPGRYRLTAVATDSAGARSKPARTSITAVRAASSR